MLRIKPIHLKAAQAYVEQYHRHKLETVGRLML